MLRLVFELIFVPWFIRSAVLDFIVFYTFITLSNISLRLKIFLWRVGDIN